MTTSITEDSIEADRTTPSGDRFIRPLTDFLRAEAGAGVLLV